MYDNRCLSKLTKVIFLYLVGERVDASKDTDVEMSHGIQKFVSHKQIRNFRKESQKSQANSFKTMCSCKERCKVEKVKVANTLDDFCWEKSLAAFLPKSRQHKPIALTDTSIFHQMYLQNLGFKVIVIFWEGG